MANNQPDILAIFTECLARDPDEKRSRYLDEACQGNPQVRGRVEELLRAHSDAGNFLGGPPPAVAPTIDQPPRRRTDSAPTSAPTSSSRKSVKAAWAWFSWPSRRSRFAARSP